jgi:hypothetical protein
MSILRHASGVNSRAMPGVQCAAELSKITLFSTFDDIGLIWEMRLAMARLYQWRLVDMGGLGSQIGKNVDCGEWEPLGFWVKDNGSVVIMYRRSAETDR